LWFVIVSLLTVYYIIQEREKSKLGHIPVFQESLSIILQYKVKYPERELVKSE
jgi:hypothetical protein